ncbi:cyclin-dependent kinase 5 activator 1-like [Porites lutea]|uniref:cyclin-dependent kinase 5 activator 1-like n=1 Tax=Porites lutea TaxID=51062 RepID=UPI003CC611FC
MGASLSISRKDLLHEYSMWNNKARESAKSFHCKCCYHVNSNSDVRVGKENKAPQTTCDAVAAYIHKCANVGKKKMKSKIEPATGKTKPKENENTLKSQTAPATVSVEQQNAKLPIMPISTDSKQVVSAGEVAVAVAPVKPKVPIASFMVSSDALKCVGNFVRCHCKNLTRFRASEVVLWLRGVDRALLLQGWQDQAFLTPPNLVFLFMLLKESLSDKIPNPAQLRAEILTCLYMAYTYNGPEISYPLKPFLIDGDRRAFWDRCMFITNNLSEKMLQMNREPRYFGELLVELKNYGNVVDRRDG